MTNKKQNLKSQHFMKIVPPLGEEPDMSPQYYVGDDLLINGGLEELEDWIYSGEDNDTSLWFKDKSHQVLLRLVNIAKRYREGVTPINVEKHYE